MEIRPRAFTIDEANILLPELRERLSKILAKRETFAKRHDFVLMHELLAEAENAEQEYAAESEELETEVRELEAAIRELERDVFEIQKFGCILRSLEPATVDFLGELNGETVYFCWKQGEPSIQYYHLCQGDWKNRLPLVTA